MLGSSLRGGAEAVGGEADHVAGRPGKVECSSTRLLKKRIALTGAGG
jgi:hypothetical protein